MKPESLIGKTLTCAETGKTFIGALDGCSTNYARDNEGNIYSDEGVDIREKRELLDRTQTFSCYLSSDGKHVTGWKGNVLGDVVTLTRGRVGFCRDGAYVTVKDVHGGMWYGKNSGKGMHINLYPKK